MTATARLLAATKFSLPAMPSTDVSRQRLHALLDAGAPLPLTVVVGVSGAGGERAATVVAAHSTPPTGCSF